MGVAWTGPHSFLLGHSGLDTVDLVGDTTVAWVALESSAVLDTGFHIDYLTGSRKVGCVGERCSDCCRMGSLGEIGLDLEYLDMAKIPRIGVVNLDRGHALVGFRLECDSQVEHTLPFGHGE